MSRNLHPDRDVFDEPLERALSWAARPEARAEFKDRLRTQFLAGAAVAESGSRAANTRSLSPRAPVLHARADQVRRIRTWATVAAVAASIVIVGLIWRGKVTPWSVIEGQGAEIVHADGKRVPLSLESSLPELLGQSRAVETGDQAVKLRLGDDCLIAISPNSRVLLPVPGTRNQAGALEVEIERGAISVATGPTIGARGMHVVTKHLEADIVGTAFGVDLYSGYSCVCCMHGKVRVRTPSGFDEGIEGGRLCMVREGGDASSGAAYAPHLTPVEELDTHARQLWP